MKLKRTRWPKGTLRFTILGNPKPKLMPRIVKGKDGKSRSFKPEATAKWEMTIAGQALQYRPPLPLTCPVALGCLFFKPIPKYISSKPVQLERAINFELVPTVKPDIKNMIASVEDALNEIFWLDDNQVVQYIAVDGLPTGKYYSQQPRIEIAVVPLPHLGK